MSRLRELRLGDRGDIPTEAAVGMFGLIVLFGLGIIGMRVYIAESAVDEAARSAARAASIAHDGHAAATAAQHRARTVLTEQHLTCRDLHVTVDASQFDRPLGETGYVTTTITCHIPYDDLLLPGITSGTKQTRAEFRSPIDRYGTRR